MAHQNMKERRSIQSILIIVNLSLILGCSMSPEPDITKLSLQSDTPLIRHGQFTDVAIRSSLRDPSIFDGSEKATDPQMNLISDPTPTPSPLKVHLPPITTHEPTLPLPSSQDHDEKWHTDLGWSLLIDGNYKGAVAAYRQALRKNREYAEAYLGLGSALKMQNEIPAAIEAYEHALELQPDNPAALVHLGSIYADGEPAHQNLEKAKQLYARASEQGDPFAKIALQDLKTRPDQ